MYSSKIAARSARAVRTNAPSVRQRVRFASSDASSSSSTGGLGAGVTGGLVGGGATLLFSYLYYRTSGLASAVDTSKQVRSYVDSTAERLKVEFQERTPEPNEAIEMLKSTAQKYATFVPGGRDVVDKAFKDLDVIREKHGDEVDKIASEAYADLRAASKGGLSLQTLSSVWEVLQKHLQSLSELAADAGQDLLNNHPELKEKMGGSFDQLKQMGDQLGPEAKKQVDETWKQVNEIVAAGVSWSSIDKIKNLVQEKSQEIQKLGDKLWEQGLEQAKPILDKNPQAKKLIEENADVLKNGNVAEAFERAKKAVSSGDLGDLEEYIDSAKSKAQQYTSGNLNQWLDKIPQGSQILPQLQKLKQVAESNSNEAQQLAKETMSDLAQVFEKRKDQLEKLGKKAADESKK